MRLTISIMICLVFTSKGLLADKLATINFDQSKITQSTINQLPGYSNLKQITIGDKVKLPVVEYLLHLNDSEKIEDISFTVLEQTKLSSKGVTYPITNLTTDAQNRYDQLLKPEKELDKLGKKHIVVNGELTIDNQRYAELLVFPITIDSSGSLNFTVASEIRVKRRLITSDNLIPRENFKATSSTPGRFPRAGVSSNSPEYLIVTSAQLASAFEPLVRYKNESGYHTELHLIEDILAVSSGRDDPEKLREYLKDFYDAGGIYLLLGGDETILPIRYAYPYNASSPPDPYRLQICDLYFADLTGDWDTDNDGIWGEKYHDNADLTPELIVGRLPLNTSREVTNYINKLILYETNPGHGSRDYLDRALFFSADQMRDYANGGQHGKIATAYPSNFIIDTVNGVETINGSDLTPINKTADQLAEVISDGFGIVNIIAHGSNSSFAVRTSGYNNWPKSSYNSGHVDDLTVNGRVSFYYSLACDNGGFDFDQAPYLDPSENLAQKLIGVDDAGAIGFVAYSRWGWISTSYLLQKEFFDSLFTHPGREAVKAMYDSKAAYYYYRDLVYGENFYGDPTLKVYSKVPGELSLSTSLDNSTLVVTVTSAGKRVAGCNLTLSYNGEIISKHTSDNNGQAEIIYGFVKGKSYLVSASMPDYTNSRVVYLPGLITGINDEPAILPTEFSLHQNYPNPFNPSTNITFDLDKMSMVNLVVYNSIGQTVNNLSEGVFTAGEYTVVWNGDNSAGNPVASGIYFYKLIAGDRTSVKKMILLR